MKHSAAIGCCEKAATRFLCFVSFRDGGSSWFALFRVQALAPTACTTIEEVGSTGVGALTLGFLALAVSTVVMVAKAASADAERRKYYFCNTFICGVATFSYFAMLSGQGWTAIAGCRQFFYARYVDWMITTALLILDLGLVAGQDFVTIAAVIGADSKSLHAS